MDKYTSFEDIILNSSEFVKNSLRKSSKESLEECWPGKLAGKFYWIPWRNPSTNSLRGIRNVFLNKFLRICLMSQEIHRFSFYSGRVLSCSRWLGYDRPVDAVLEGFELLRHYVVNFTFNSYHYLSYFAKLMDPIRGPVTKIVQQEWLSKTTTWS